MVERVPPAAVAGGCALLGLLAAGVDLRVAACVFAAGTVLAAAASAWSPLAAGGTDRARARALLAAGFGGAVGGLLAAGIGIDDLRAYVGLPLPSVGYVEVTAVEDSKPGETLGSVARVELERVATRDRAAWAGARGEARLLLPDGVRITAGEKLVVSGSLKRSAPSQELAISSRSVERAGFGRPAAEIRSRLRTAIERAAGRMGYPASALFLALFLGDRYGIPREMRSAFQRTGTLHLLALSGLHVGVLYAIAAFALRSWLSPKPRGCVVVTLAAFYLWLAGPAPSLLRATLAFGATTAARLLDRDRRPANILGLVLLVHLVLDPRDAGTAAFQLSYAAVAGLAAGHAVLSGPLERWLPPILAQPLAATVGAQAATLPLSLAFFGLWYPSGVAATVLGAPLVELFLCVGLVALPLLALPLHTLPLAPLAAAVPAVMGGLYGALLAGGRLLACPPVAGTALGGKVLLAAAAPVCVLGSLAVAAAAGRGGAARGRLP